MTQLLTIPEINKRLQCSNVDCDISHYESVKPMILKLHKLAPFTDSSLEELLDEMPVSISGSEQFLKEKIREMKDEIYTIKRDENEDFYHANGYYP